MRDEARDALKKYRAGMSITSIARDYHVTPQTVSTWIDAAVSAEDDRRAERSKAVHAKAKADKVQRCAHCRWSTGTGVCVLPRCMKERT